MEPVHIAVEIVLANKGQENIAGFCVRILGVYIQGMPFAIGWQSNGGQNLVAYTVFVNDDATACCTSDTDGNTRSTGAAYFIKLSPSAILCSSQ